MKRAILAYGHSILKQRCNAIENGYPQLDELIADMWETMENANGCGLASPQVGVPIRLFIVDSKSTFDNLNVTDRNNYFSPEDSGIRETFINARIVERSSECWEDEEGCLSIPGLSLKVKRPWTIKIEYENQHFERQVRSFSGATARMVQHEYDHINGVLYLDYLKPLTKKMIETKLLKIAKGQVKTLYPMRFV